MTDDDQPPDPAPGPSGDAARDDGDVNQRLAAVERVLGPVMRPGRERDPRRR